MKKVLLLLAFLLIVKHLLQYVKMIILIYIVLIKKHFKK